MEEENQYFSGRVHTVTYSNVANSFYVLRMVLESKEDSKDPLLTFRKGVVTVRGNVPGILIGIGTWFGFYGKWVNHPKFGKQIEISQAPVIRDEDWNANYMIKMLSAQGVAKTLLARVYSRYSDDAEFEKALSNPDMLIDVPAITEAEIMTITSKWKTTVTEFRAVEFLNKIGVPNGVIQKVRSTFPDDLQEIVTENPWRLVEVPGLNFSEVDAVARRMGKDCTSDNPLRVQGMVVSAVYGSIGMGHLFVDVAAVVGEAMSWDANVSPKDIALALKTLHTEGRIYLDRETGDTKAVYTPWNYKIENESAIEVSNRTASAALTASKEREILKVLLSKTSSEIDGVSGIDLETAVRKSIDVISEISGISLTRDQFQGVLNGALEPVSIITGLPGTGKSTSLKTLVQVLSNMGQSILLVAPTGIAAKNMASLTGVAASTIHRALGASGSDSGDRESVYAGVIGDALGLDIDQGSSESWGHDAANPHLADVVIVDESSMVDQHLMYRLLTATKKSCRIVFVGDDAQLPSVGPGNVLREIIRSQRFPTVQLMDIFRQEETSDIVRAAHDIFHGEYPEYGDSKEFRLIEVRSEEEALDAVIKMSEKLYEKRKNFQILSPRHKGKIGVTNLNSSLRERLNPSSPGCNEVRIGSEVLRESDRVMVIKNDYEIGVFNGDVGKIVRFNPATETLEVKVHGPPVMHFEIPYKKVASLIRLAYAVTVHKSQGLAYDVVVIPVMSSFGRQLQRNLFYTGITRARKQVIMVGSRKALHQAVINSQEQARNTLLANRIQNLIQGEG